MRAIDFFRADLSEVVGVYYDGEKIYLTRLTDAVESVDVNFELDLNDKASEIEQLATRISMACSQRGWKTSRMGLCLREGTATTLLTDFRSVPANEIESAVKIWAIAHVGKEAAYTSIKFDDEIWMETLPQGIVDEYTAAWDKNSMTLSALTDLPPNFVAENEFSRSQFVAEVIKHKGMPNLLSARTGIWNVKRIVAIVAVIFLLILGGVSAKMFYEYRQTSTQLEIVRANITAMSDIADLKEIVDADIAEMKRINEMSASQNISMRKFNILIRLGKLADGRVILRRLRISDDSVSLEGFTENPAALKFYIGRLKASALYNVKLENSSVADGQISFGIRADLSK